MKKILSSGIVPIIFEDQPRYLLLRSGAYWDFPKGLVNNAEAAITAAIRELQEETGLTCPNFVWGEQFLETCPYGQFKKVARYYLAEMPQPVPEVVLPVNLELGHPEHDEFRWCSYEKAKCLLGARVGRILRWAHKTIER